LQVLAGREWKVLRRFVDCGAGATLAVTMIYMTIFLEFQGQDALLDI
jgi:hypothetical protein